MNQIAVSGFTLTYVLDHLEEVREHYLAKLKDRRCIVNISGGKDSTASALFLRLLEIPFDRVFCNTGWEADVTFDYVKNYLPDQIGEIVWLQGAFTMPELIRKKAMFPSRTRRFCTEHLKVIPIQEYLNARDDEVVNVVGIRRAESEERKHSTEWEWSKGFDCETWRPLVEFTLDDVIAIHRLFNVRPNPLYLLKTKGNNGFSRVGCFPCIYANKAEIRAISELQPSRIDEIETLEAEVTASAEARYKAKNETFESLGYVRPGFFHSPFATYRLAKCKICKGSGRQRTTADDSGRQRTTADFAQSVKGVARGKSRMERPGKSGILSNGLRQLEEADNFH